MFQTVIKCIYNKDTDNDKDTGGMTMRETINELFINLCTSDESSIDYNYLNLIDATSYLYLVDEISKEELNYISDSACAVIYNH